MFSDRIIKVRNLLQEKGIDAFLVSAPMNLTYLSGFVCLSPTEREAYILVTQKSAYIITNSLYAEEVNNKDFSVILLSSHKPLSTAISDVLKNESLETLGFEEDDLKFYEYERLSKQDIPLIPWHLANLRTIKDKKEIEKIAEACAIGDKAFEYILKVIKPGMSEEDLAVELELFIRKQHATLSFPSIIAFGENAAVPHHQTSARTLKKNEFVLLDFGVQYRSYCSDMSRTVFVGIPTDEEKHMYYTVLKAQQRAIDYILSEETNSIAEKADKLARDFLIENKFPSFPHSLGHGIGLEVHEAPSLSPYSKSLLENGMVFSVEPGLYVSGTCGIRIEDLMVIEPGKTRLLTKAPRELILL